VVRPLGDALLAVASSQATTELLQEDCGTLTSELLARIADFLRNPADARDCNDSPGAAADRRGLSDRFGLRLIKPR